MKFRHILFGMLCVGCIGLLLSACGGGTSAPTEDPLPEMKIETSRGTLYFPATWEDRVTVNVSENETNSIASFSADIGGKRVRLFDVRLDGDKTDSIGTVTRDGTAYYAHIDPEEEAPAEDPDLFYAMQEDVNYLIGRLG